MKTSNVGIALIKSFESCRLTSYKAVLTEKYYTIGWGHYGSDVKKGMKITQAQADAYLVKDLAKFEAKVNKYVNKYRFNQNQYDSLVCFAYNVGSIDGLTANGTRTIAQISAKFLSYNKSGGKVLTGLTNRRKKEKALFDKPVISSVSNFVKDGVDYSKVFDPVYYADNNPDVVKALGRDPQALFNHFYNFGCEEKSRWGKTISDFNVWVYANHNPDLVKAFGSINPTTGGNALPYYRHYCTNGYKENRRTI